MISQIVQMLVYQSPQDSVVGEFRLEHGSTDLLDMAWKIAEKLTYYHGMRKILWTRMSPYIVLT